MCVQFSTFETGIDCNAGLLKGVMAWGGPEAGEGPLGRRQGEVGHGGCPVAGDFPCKAGGFGDFPLWGYKVFIFIQQCSRRKMYAAVHSLNFLEIPFIIFIHNRNTLKKPYLSCCFFMNLSFWSSSCFLRRAVCMMACVCAISSWGLGTRGTTGGRMVAVPVDCKTNHMVSIEIFWIICVPSMNKQDAIGQIAPI